MKLRIIYIVAFIFSIFCTSCDSWLDTDPKDGLPAEKVLTYLNACEGLLIGTYDDLQATAYYGRNMICTPEILADNCGLIPGGTMFKDAYHNVVGSGVNIWSEAYKIVSIANDILNSIDDIGVDGAEVNRRNRIKGEAYFLRSLAYFDLMRSYAREPSYLINSFDLGVPHVVDIFVSTGTSLPPTAFPERAKVGVIWAQIEEDLGNAFDLLKDNDSNNFPQRANSYAAKSLLARVYLYQEKWAEAASAADWVIKSSVKDLYTGDYKNIYTGSEESIFELQYASFEALGASSLHSIYGRMDDGYRDSDGDGNDTGVGYGELIVGDAIRALFEPGDKRATMMRRVKLNNTSNTVWWTTKFNSWRGAYGQDNVPIIRVAELYLIRAEASLNLPTPDYTTARVDINKIRTTRGLGDTPEADANLLNALHKERRLELCFEGHRFFDLKRRGMDILKEGGQAAIPYADFRIVAGIPQREIDVNKNLRNNPGY